MIGFLYFLKFLGPSEKKYNLQSLMITLYANHCLIIVSVRAESVPRENYPMSPGLDRTITSGNKKDSNEPMPNTNRKHCL